jgi:hypothetical protein
MRIHKLRTMADGNQRTRMRRSHRNSRSRNRYSHTIRKPTLA